MKELVYHRLLLPAIDTTPTRSASSTGLQGHLRRARRPGAAARATRCDTSSASAAADRFAVMALNSHQYLELYHAAFLGAGVINPLNLRLAGAGARLHRPRLGHRRSSSSTPCSPTHFAQAWRRASRARSGTWCSSATATCPTTSRYEDLLAPVRAGRARRARGGRPASSSCTRAARPACPRASLLDQRAEMLNLYHVGMIDRTSTTESVYLHQTPMFHAASMGGIMGITPRPGARRCSSRCSTRAAPWT